MANMKPCHFCGKKLEQPGIYPKFDKGTVYGCVLVHNCESGIRIHIKSTKHYRSKEEALRKVIEIWNGYGEEERNSDKENLKLNN